MMDGPVNSLCPESVISCHSHHQTSRAFRVDQSWRIYFAGSIKGVEVLSIKLSNFFFPVGWKARRKEKEPCLSRVKESVFRLKPMVAEKRILESQPHLIEKKRNRKRSFVMLNL